MKYKVKDINKVFPAKTRRNPKTMTPQEREAMFPHVSVVFKSPEELIEFDNAIAEERKATKVTGLNRSSIIRKLVKKWVNYEVTL